MISGAKLSPSPFSCGIRIRDISRSVHPASRLRFFSASSFGTACCGTLRTAESFGPPEIRIFEALQRHTHTQTEKKIQVWGKKVTVEYTFSQCLSFGFFFRKPEFRGMRTTPYLNSSKSVEIAIVLLLFPQFAGRRICILLVYHWVSDLPFRCAS